MQFMINRFYITSPPANKETKGNFEKSKPCSET